MKLLISAYACSPFMGSEPGIGWGFVSALAKRNVVYVITEKDEFENDIQQYFDAHPELKDNLKFIYVRRMRFKILEKIWPPSYYWTYRTWQKNALKAALELQHDIHFDLVHQLNMIGFREPGYLWKLNAPFVWGPIGGMGKVPWRFIFKMGPYGSFYFIAYNLINYFQMLLLTRPKLAARSAGTGLIADNTQSKENAVKYWGCNSVVLCAVGSSRKQASKFKTRSVGEPMKIVWSGLHIPRKALNLALETVSLLPEEIKWELHILGDGPCALRWKHLAEKLKIADRCRFYGHLSREKALDVMEESHVTLITSLKDDSPSVAVEALGMGMPVICLDHCGFSDVVTDQSGFKIPVTNPKLAVKEMALALMKLSRDEALRQSLAMGALTRAKEFSWDKKIETLENIYLDKLNEASSLR
jgi:glycosyltransferase involved in cell wall biosynthesis